ncbi:transcriptional regulator NanR [Bauldia litoralis]|uniref:transcriptional regulator NanR n=1 Tax=Bauldia litoralis TaxID=665467 RepID=UPI003264401F
MNKQENPIRRRKLSDDVQDRLLQLIESDGLGPGDHLPSERELMDTYHVGRPAVREALHNLRRMGLVEIRHGERSRVATPSLDNVVEEMSNTMRHLLAHSATSLEHLKEARVTFETEMARIAARRHTERDLLELRRIVAAQSDARSQPNEFMRLDGEFHRRIAAVAGNPIFESLSHAIFSWLANFHINLVRKHGSEKLTMEEHQAILDAISDGDDIEAGARMADHLNRVNRLRPQHNDREDGQ